MSRQQPTPLKIIEQPLSLFWKDRGGKRNMLRCIVEAPIKLNHVSARLKTTRSCFTISRCETAIT